MSELEAELAAIVRADAGLMHVLTTVRALDLPDWRLVSGAVYQAVWNARTGRAVGYGVKDYDIGYFDPDVSWDAEDVVIKRVAAAFDEPFRTDVEVRNQARVHIWFPDRFGEPYAPLPSTDEALERFVAPTFAVGVRLADHGRRAQQAVRVAVGHRARRLLGARRISGRMTAAR